MTGFPERIVYIDDDENLRQLVKICLERSGEKYVLANCNSGHELLARVRELQPDLILMDLMMPDMTGPDILEALRKNESSARIPVIFITGKTKVEMIDDYRHLDVIGVIHKPFDTKTFVDTIRDFWKVFNDGKAAPPEAAS